MERGQVTRFLLSKAQLEEYYDRIALPETKRLFSTSLLEASAKLDYLELLRKHQLVRVPFENLLQHYSWHRVINTDPLHVFRKIMTQPGRGGWCMEVNVLFHTVLLTLGFQCYLVPGRIKSPDGWSSLAHVVNIVFVDDHKYYCDVGFGRDLPMRLIPLENEHTIAGIGPGQSRIVYQKLAEFLGDDKVWLLQSQDSDQAEWRTLYCFSDMELMPRDVIGLNYAPWLGHASFLGQNILCVRYTVGEQAEYDSTRSDDIEKHGIDGTLILWNKSLKWTRNGNIVIDATFESETERIEALRKYWGMELDELDVKAINGTALAIR